MAAIGAAQVQVTVRQDAALDEGVELAPDDLRQAGVGGRLALREEGLRVLLKQAVKRGLFGAVGNAADANVLEQCGIDGSAGPWVRAARAGLPA